jgi:hypothetical protein
MHSPVGASLLAKTDFQTQKNHGFMTSANSHSVPLKHPNQHHPAITNIAPPPAPPSTASRYQTGNALWSTDNSVERADTAGDSARLKK